MPKKKNLTTPEVVLTPDGSQSDTAQADAFPVSLPVPNARLADEDRMALELAKQQKLTAVAEAKTAIAVAEKADTNYKYVVLQLYRKYALSDADAISEGGEIIKNGALQQPQK